MAEAERGWEKEIRLLKTTQRADYREFVLSYYKRPVDGSGPPQPQPQPQPADVVTTPLEPARQTAAPAAAGAAPPRPEVADLVEMGFSAAQAECALVLTEWRKARAKAPAPLAIPDCQELG